jgi:hypothetical protein
MTMSATPELGIPLEDEVKKIPLPERASALGKTVDELEKYGVDLEPDEADKEVAATLARHTRKTLIKRPIKSQINVLRS